MCLAQGHKAVKFVRLDPVASRSRVKHSSTEPPTGYKVNFKVKNNNHEINLDNFFPLIILGEY